MAKKAVVIFSDLDGTLLDSRYSFSSALPALSLLRERNIPLVLCSSKTRVEIEYYRQRLDNTDPFISENGGGVFIPRGYFSHSIDNASEYNGYYLIRLGAPYTELRRALGELRSEGFDVRGFGDMDVNEVARLTGMDIHEAEMAMVRDFDEPFVFNGTEESVGELISSIRRKGLNYTRGRFFHLMGNSDKGKAVRILKDLYIKEYGQVLSVALGDGQNDIPMLKEVDFPIAIKRQECSYDPQLLRELAHSTRLIRAEGIGPEGWNDAVLMLLKAVLL